MYPVARTSVPRPPHPSVASNLTAICSMMWATFGFASFINGNFVNTGIFEDCFIVFAASVIYKIQFAFADSFHGNTGTIENYMTFTIVLHNTFAEDVVKTISSNLFKSLSDVFPNNVKTTFKKQTITVSMSVKPTSVSANKAMINLLTTLCKTDDGLSNKIAEYIAASRAPQAAAAPVAVPVAFNLEAAFPGVAKATATPQRHQAKTGFAASARVGATLAPSPVKSSDPISNADAIDLIAVLTAAKQAVENTQKAAQLATANVATIQAAIDAEEAKLMTRLAQFQALHAPVPVPVITVSSPSQSGPLVAGLAPPPVANTTESSPSSSDWVAAPAPNKGSGVKFKAAPPIGPVQNIGGSFAALNVDAPVFVPPFNSWADAPN